MQHNDKIVDLINDESYAKSQGIKVNHTTYYDSMNYKIFVGFAYKEPEFLIADKVVRIFNMVAFWFVF